MYYTMNRRSNFGKSGLFSGLLVVSLLGIAGAALVPKEVIDLSSKNSPDASITNKGGAFGSGGWTATKEPNYLITKLNKPIGKNEWAAVELEVTNFDLKHHLKGVISDFFCVFNTPNGRPLSGTSGSWITVRCKGETRPNVAGFSKKIDGKNAQGFRFVYRPTAKGNKKESMGSACNRANWSVSKVYRFKFEFQQHRVLFYVNDVLGWGIPDFNRATQMAYILAGGTSYTNNEWGSFQGMTCRKITIYRDDGTPPPADPLFSTSNHIKINVGGYDDMVEGWHGAVPYATKGHEFQWFRSSFTTEGTKNAAPIDIYKTLLHKNHHYDTKKIYQDSVEMIFPVRKGNWTVRIHVIDGEDPAIAKRSIDLELNGNKVLDNVDYRVLAGGRSKAYTQDFPVTISGNEGLTVTLFDDTHNPSEDFFLNGIEFISSGAAPNPTSLLMPHQWQTGRAQSLSPRPVVFIDAAGRIHGGSITDHAASSVRYQKHIREDAASRIVVQP